VPKAAAVSGISAYLVSFSGAGLSEALSDSDLFAGAASSDSATYSATCTFWALIESAAWSTCMDSSTDGLCSWAGSAFEASNLKSWACGGSPSLTDRALSSFATIGASFWLDSFVFLI